MSKDIVIETNHDDTVAARNTLEQMCARLWADIRQTPGLDDLNEYRRVISLKADTFSIQVLQEWPVNPPQSAHFHVYHKVFIALNEVRIDTHYPVSVNGAYEMKLDSLMLQDIQLPLFTLQGLVELLSQLTDLRVKLNELLHLV